MSISHEPYSEAFYPPEENRLYSELFTLHCEIHAFSDELDNFPRLLGIQKRLINAISETEAEIRKAKIIGCDARDWQYVRYNFQCLGDSLAFLYMDRFALKQTFFDVDSQNPKQSGGFISDKSGHETEVFWLETAISHNVPAILCDITNVLRYGDICLLGDSDPLPIEIKSSKTKDRRGKRQLQKLKSLYDFFKSDQREGFRGLPGTTIRTGFYAAPKTYSSRLQAAIGDAAKNGTASFEVDGCLKVAVIAEEGTDCGELFCGFGSDRVLANAVNAIKTNKLWGCYYPYALTLSEPEHFERFVRGEIHIFTLLDMAAFENKLATDGVELAVEANEYDIECRIKFFDLFPDCQEAFFVIGEHMMCRMWTDFMHPSWIVHNSIASVKNNAESMIEAFNGNPLK
jgi:hypothetical protein